MPLAFHSISHATIAFGFFNIDSDMLLLEDYFFFATSFCKYISEIAEPNHGKVLNTLWKVFHIADPQDIGDLTGAINGIRHTGFIGEVYRGFPFPRQPENFKQKPDGFKTRSVMEKIISKYATQIDISFSVDKTGEKVTIDDYQFSRASFQELIKYVWKGGYPRWKDEIRPDYVLAMKKNIEKSKNRLFEKILF